MTNICARCKKRKALKGASRCKPCREAELVYWRRLRKERQKEGVCPKCGRKPARGRKYCAEHLAYHAEAARQYRERQRTAKGTKSAKAAKARRKSASA